MRNGFNDNNPDVDGETGETSDWINYVRNNSNSFFTDIITVERTIPASTSSDPRAGQVVVTQEAATEFVAVPRVTTFHIMSEKEEVMLTEVKQRIEAIKQEIPADYTLCVNESSAQQVINSLDRVAEMTSLLNDGFKLVLRDLKTEANKHEYQDRKAGNFLKATIGWFKWSQREIERLETYTGVGSSIGQYDLSQIIIELDERLFEVLAPKYLEHFVDEGESYYKEYQDLADDFVEDTVVKEHRKETLLETLTSVQNEASAELKNDRFTISRYRSELRNIETHMITVEGAAVAVSDYCNFFMDARMFREDIQKVCSSKEYYDLISAVNEYLSEEQVLIRRFTGSRP